VILLLIEDRCSQFDFKGSLNAIKELEKENPQEAAAHSGDLDILPLVRRTNIHNIILLINVYLAVIFLETKLNYLERKILIWKIWGLLQNR
jgi:hypothetical protein